VLPNLDKTELKSLLSRTTATSITLQWDSWRGPLQSDHSLAYQVQYQAVAGVTGVSGNIMWTPWTNETTLVTDSDGPYEVTTVSSLGAQHFLQVSHSASRVDNARDVCYRRLQCRQHSSAHGLSR
jgi:hypothetical protein